MKKEGEKWGGILEIGLKSFYADKNFCKKFSDAKEIYYWELFVNDQGVGMSESVKTKIFDPFFTTKEVDKGTGQGLAIAHDVVTKKHNGTIKVDSVENEGTVFTISIPTQLPTVSNEERGQGSHKFN